MCKAICDLATKGRALGGAEVPPEGLEVFTYKDQKGQLIHALATVKAEREFLRQVPSKLLPLYVRMEQSLAKAVGLS